MEKNKVISRHIRSLITRGSMFFLRRTLSWLLRISDDLAQSKKLIRGSRLLSDTARQSSENDDWWQKWKKWQYETILMSNLLLLCFLIIEFDCEVKREKLRRVDQENDWSLLIFRLSGPTVCRLSPLANVNRSRVRRRESYRTFASILRLKRFRGGERETGEWQGENECERRVRMRNKGGKSNAWIWDLIFSLSSSSAMLNYALLFFFSSDFLFISSSPRRAQPVVLSLYLPAALLKCIRCLVDK